MNADARDRAYIEGQHTVYRRQLESALRELRGDGVPESDPLVALASAELRLDRCRVALRRVCAGIGDNTWPDDADLGDVIEKCLEPYLFDTPKRP